MNPNNSLSRYHRLHFLIKTSSTGSPTELARRFNISERQIYRIIAELKDLGLPVIFDRTKQCYRYSEEVHLTVKITVGEKNIKLL